MFYFSFIMCHSPLDMILGYKIESGDARSIGIGNSFFSTGTTSMITSVNPAKLSYLSDNILLFDFSLDAKSSFERRSIPILDGWGEFLADADYVFNEHHNYYNSFGFIFGLDLSENQNIGFGLSTKTFKTFDYTYEEEVRSEQDVDDGYVGMKDPIVGYQVYNSNGSLDIESFGISYSNSFNNNADPIAIGLAINRLKPATITEKKYIDTLFYTNDANFDYNFDDFDKDTTSIDISSKYYATISFEIPYKSALFMLGYETKADYNDSTLYKPEKATLGVKLRPKYNMLMVFEYHLEDYLTQEVDEYRIGFEYNPIKGMPLRAGLTYRDWIFDEISTFTIGTGKKIGNFNFDIALSYYSSTYNWFNPLTSMEDILSNNITIDKVTDNHLNISTTFKWSF